MSVQTPQSGQIPIEQFVAVIDQELKKPRPRWAKLAVAKLLHIVLPNLKVRRCFEFVENPDLVSALFTAAEMPWILGRITRCFAEIRKIGPDHFPFLEKMPWLLTLKFENGQILPAGGRGLEELVLHEMTGAMQAPIEIQAKFWMEFAKGFKRDVMPRRQDMKSFIVYVFLAINWQAAGECPTVRHLYDFVFSKIPKAGCPAGVDPVDFEETQVKWFEKLCHRNLKLQLAKPGRPEEVTKIPQSR